MRPHLACALCAALLCGVPDAAAQQVAGPGDVVRPRAAETPEGVTVIGCVLPEARPNAFRLVVVPPEVKRGTA